MSLGHKTKPAPPHPHPECCLQLMLTEAPLKTGGQEERPSNRKAVLYSPGHVHPLWRADHSSLHTEEEAQRKLSAEQTMEPKLRGIFLEPRLF